MVTSKNAKVVLYPTPQTDKTWKKEWVVHGQVLWKGKPLFNLVESLADNSFFIRADDVPTLKCNWGAAGSLDALVDRAHAAVIEFECFLQEMHQRPKL